MPVSMKIQPIDVGGDVGGGDHLRSELVAPSFTVAAKPVVKSRFKRLFRISLAEKDDSVSVYNNSAELFEPSSVCLAKMVQNFIEESNEKQSSHRRCNCFNGNGSDGSEGDTESVSPADVCDFLKSLVGCASVHERTVMAETAKIVADKNKACKRKDELRKIVTEGLVSLGFNAAICKSKWDKSPSYLAGEYEYVDVIIGDERLIIDIDFRSEFEVAKSTKTYKSILQILPHIFVGKSDRLSKIISILSEAAKQSLKKKGMHIPPWRKADYVQAKWLSPPIRLLSAVATATPPPVSFSPASSIVDFGGSTPEKAPVAKSQESERSPEFETVFDMSESSGEEEVKEKKDEKP